MKRKLLIPFLALAMSISSAYAVQPVAEGGNDKIEVVITPQTSQADLELIAVRLKEQGYDFRVTNTNYNNGLLTDIEFKVKGDGMNGNFSETGISGDEKIYLVIDKKKNSMHIGNSPEPNSYEKCSKTCAGGKMI